MKEIDIIKDILLYRISSQRFYNDQMVLIGNPEARQLFRHLRDDETREVIRLQELKKRFDSQDTIVQKIFPTRTKF